MKQQTQTPDTTKQKELHTQGEWEFDGMELIMCGDEVIADIRSCNHDGMEFDGQVFNRSQEEAVANAELIVKAVNERQALLDSHSELLAALLKAKTDIYNLANGINGKRYVLDMISDIDTVTNKIAK